MADASTCARWLPRVPALLRWDAPSDVPATAQRDLARLLRARFDHLDLKPRFAVDEPTLARVLDAPASAFRLLFTPGRPLETTRFLIDALATETDAVRMHGRIDLDRWTADGACFLGAGGLPAVDVDNPAIRVDERATRWRAPTLAGRIPIDWRSPRVKHLDVLGDGRRPSRWPELDSTEARRVVTRVRDAHTAVARVSPSAADLVTRCTRVIAVRTKPTAPEQFFAGSSNRLPGQTLLMNAHAPGDLVPEIAEALVHEAIHALLYVDELTSPWVGTAGPPNDVLFESPWSGRRIPLRVYLHACFVWAGLDAFWRQAARTNLFAPAVVDCHLEQTARGFRSGRVLDVVEEFAAVIDPEVAATVEDIEATVGLQV